MTHTEPADLMLSTRIEQSASGSRELDAEIAKAVGAPRGPKSGFSNSENGDYFVIDECALAYTTSLDAALMLFDKPDIEMSIGAGERPYVDISAMVPRDYEPWLVCAETPALSLAAAAMRVRGL